MISHRVSVIANLFSFICLLVSISLVLSNSWKMKAPMMQYPTTRDRRPMCERRKEVTDLVTFRHEAHLVGWSAALALPPE